MLTKIKNQKLKTKHQKKKNLYTRKSTRHHTKRIQKNKKKILRGGDDHPTTAEGYFEMLSSYFDSGIESNMEDYLRELLNNLSEEEKNTLVEKLQYHMKVNTDKQVQKTINYFLNEIALNTSDEYFKILSVQYFNDGILQDKEPELIKRFNDLPEQEKETLVSKVEEYKSKLVKGHNDLKIKTIDYFLRLINDPISTSNGPRTKKRLATPKRRISKSLRRTIDTPILDALKRKYYYFVFDFDETIVRAAIGPVSRDNPHYQDQRINDKAGTVNKTLLQKEKDPFTKEDLEAFCFEEGKYLSAFLTNLIRDGKTVAIISFGRPIVIRKFLEILLGKEISQQIHVLSPLSDTTLDQEEVKPEIRELYEKKNPSEKEKDKINKKAYSYGMDFRKSYEMMQFLYGIEDSIEERKRLLMNLDGNQPGTFTTFKSEMGGKIDKTVFFDDDFKNAFFIQKNLGIKSINVVAELPDGRTGQRGFTFNYLSQVFDQEDGVVSTNISESIKRELEEVDPSLGSSSS